MPCVTAPSGATTQRLAPPPSADWRHPAIGAITQRRLAPPPSAIGATRGQVGAVCGGFRYNQRKPPQTGKRITTNGQSTYKGVGSG